jgi:prepilin-type N-terminal cleavage/methylation domain-containing protein
MKKHQNGFTLIEMAVTMAIILILSGLAVSSIVKSQPRFRVRGDSWAIYQALNKAKFLSIDTNRPHGVMFYHSGNNLPDYFFVFQDWNDNQSYDVGSDGPLIQCNPNILGWATCPQDPIIGGLTPLHSSNIFISAFGTDLTTAGSYAFVTFTPLGSVAQIGTLASSDVVIQSIIMFDRVNRQSYTGGGTLDFASGIASRLPIVPGVLP